jgi:serine protease Do
MYVARHKINARSTDWTANSRWLPLFAAANVIVLAMIWSHTAAARGAPESFADLAEVLLPSVVNIQVTQTVTPSNSGNQGRPPFIPQLPPGSPFEEFFKEYFDRQQREGQKSRPVAAVGSGFIIDASGLVVTNNHVVDEADAITVITHDGERLEAEVVGTDPETDLAVLRVKTKNGDKLTPVSWGNSDAARVGDWVIAIGNPLGLGGTVTAGIISARGRDIRAGRYDDFIQTDAPINKGNSGGPLFNMDGHVIGINTAIYSQSGGSIGIGFSVPSKLASHVVDQLMKFGRTKRGWLGVNIQTVTEDLAEGLGLKDASGALVARVFDDSPAAKAGVKQGDVITKFAGVKIGEMKQLPRIVAETVVDSTVKMEVWRKGETKSLSVTVGELEKAEQALAALNPNQPAETETKSKLSALGMILKGMTPELRERFQIGENVKGVVVTEVEPDSPATDENIRPGDVIVEVGQEVVEAPKDVADKVAAERKAGKKKTVLFLVNRAGNLLFIAVALNAGDKD